MSPVILHQTPSSWRVLKNRKGQRSVIAGVIFYRDPSEYNWWKCKPLVTKREFVCDWLCPFQIHLVWPKQWCVYILPLFTALPCCSILTLMPSLQIYEIFSWWRHHMETIPALLPSHRQIPLAEGCYTWLYMRKHLQYLSHIKQINFVSYAL